MEHLKLVRFSHPLLIISVRNLGFTRLLAFFLWKNKIRNNYGTKIKEQYTSCMNLRDSFLLLNTERKHMCIRQEVSIYPLELLGDSGKYQWWCDRGFNIPKWIRSGPSAIHQKGTYSRGLWYVRHIRKYDVDRVRGICRGLYSLWANFYVLC